MKAKEFRGSLCAISSGFLYGSVGYFGVSVIKAAFSVPNMLFWRFFIASLFMVFIIVFSPKNTYPNTLKDIMRAFVNGALFYGLSTMLYFFACPYIGSGLAMVVFFTYPAMVMLLNYLIYGHHIPRIYYLAIITILFGLTFFVDRNHMEFNLLGIVLSILSAVLYAAYIVSSKSNTKLSTNVSTLTVCLGCMTTSIILALYDHSFVIPSGMDVWINLLGIGILATTLPILLLLRGLNYISSVKSSILSVLEPVFVLILGVVLLHEPMKGQYILGVISVLTGALIALFAQQQAIIEKRK